MFLAARLNVSLVTIKKNKNILSNAEDHLFDRSIPYHAPTYRLKTHNFTIKIDRTLQICNSQGYMFNHGLHLTYPSFELF